MSPMKSRWTLKETEFLKSNMSILSFEELYIHFPNRSEYSVRLKMSELFSPEHIEDYKDDIINEYSKQRVGIKTLAKKYKFSQKFIGDSLKSWGIKLRTRNRNYRENCGSKNKGWTGHGDISGRMFSAIKRDALRREIQFDVTIQQIWELFLTQNATCVLSGQSIKISNRTDLCTASLDRKDCNIGYTISNLQWVHKKVNIMKNRFSDTEYIAWCRLVVNNQQVKEEIGIEPMVNDLPCL